MISKIIHYCWFGGNSLPELAVKCIDSWKKYLPDYEIKEWNESNFDLNCCDYVREAYEAKKWAFVSDYARFWILYNYGGLYFDTDVEVIKPMGDIIAKGAFMGCEPTLAQKGKSLLSDDSKAGFTASGSAFLESEAVNPGLGLAAAPGLGLYKEILDDYELDHFELPEKGGPLTVVERVTKILLKHGFKNQGDSVQQVDGVYIYPPEYFCPLNYNTGVLTITDNTRSIHHYTASWLNERENKEAEICQRYAREGRAGCRMERLQTLPLRLANKFERLGLIGTVRFAVKKVFREL